MINLGKPGRGVEAQKSRRPGKHADRVPNRAVARMRHDRVGAGARHDTLVLARIDCLVRLDVLVALAVAIGVEDERRPALRLRSIAGRIEHLGVEPSRDRPRAAEPQRVVGVIAELQVMGAEAGVDEGVLHRLGIENCRLPPRPFNGKDF